MLLFMTEEEAFWMLQTIADNILCEYYTDGMIGTVVLRVLSACTHACCLLHVLSCTSVSDYLCANLVIGLHGDMKLLQSLLEQHTPRALAHLLEIGGDVSMIAMKFLMCLGVSQFPTEVRCCGTNNVWTRAC